MAQNTYAPGFVPLDQQDGIRIDDPVEDVQFTLYTPGGVSVTPADSDDAAWCFPIDSAAVLDTNAVTVPVRVNANVRAPDGTLVASATNDEGVSVPVPGPYTVEFSSTPIKLFVHAESRVEVEPDDHETRVRFPDVDRLAVGARTLHKQPARTLTTTRDMHDVMRVVSEFGAALKATSCERSFPTLRGHPPLVAFGDEVSIPGGSRRPDTGVRLEVPAEPEYVFPVAPLAYYLGAEVVPAATPRLATENGFEYDLGGEFEPTVKRLLRHVFTLDCLTRVEGYYPVELAERERAAASGIDLDWGALYDRSLAEQLETYLSVPFDDLEPVVPQWRLTADVVPSVEHATVLPHLANELATVRIHANATEPSADEPTGVPSETTNVRDAIDEFVRGPALTRGSNVGRRNDEHHPPVTREDVFRVPDADTATQTYIGDGFPLNANKGSRLSYERQLTLRSRSSNRIGVTVVCNDPEMLDELEVGDHYGTRDLFDFDIELHRELSVAELREVFTADADLVHYIGHVDQRGLQAADGYLDAMALEDVGTTAFILNGCRSFRQGQALVDRGAIAGIVTLENVHNSLATEIGTNIARLLNQGWPLDAAIEIVKDDALVGRHYIVVGDGSIEIANPDSGVPTTSIISPRWDENFDVTIRAYATQSRHLGSMYVPYIAENRTYYLGSGELDTFTVSETQLAEFLQLETEPIQLRHERETTTVSLRWSSDLDVESIRSENY